MLLFIFLFLVFAGFLGLILGPAFYKVEKKKQSEEAEIRRFQLEKPNKEESAE